MKTEKQEPFTTVPDDAVDELLRQAEQCLSGTIQLALAADHRGTTMTGIFGAASVALLAGAAATVTVEAEFGKLFLPFAVTAVGIFIAALLCAWSSRPTDFFICGYEPRLLAQRSNDGLYWLKRHAIADAQMKINKNRRALAIAASHYSRGVLIGGVSPFLGVATYLCL